MDATQPVIDPGEFTLRLCVTMSVLVVIAGFLWASLLRFLGKRRSGRGRDDNIGL